MAAKMLQITAQNGTGGYGNSPAFAFAAALHQRDEQQQELSPNAWYQNTPLLL